MPGFLKQINNFEMNVITALSRILRILNIHDPVFSAFLMDHLYSSSNRLNLKEILDLLIYLSSVKNFPN